MTERQAYSARQLIDLALDGHYLFNDVVFETVWRLYGRFGEFAKEKLYRLPDVAVRASTEEIDQWARRLFDVELELQRQLAAPSGYEDVHQPKLPWPANG